MTVVDLAAESDIPSELLLLRRTSNRGSVLMAAMLGLAQALGWENNREQTVEIAEADIDIGLRLTFGELPPLD